MSVRTVRCSINCLVFVTGRVSLYWAVRPKTFCIFEVKFSLEGVKDQKFSWYFISKSAETKLTFSNAKLFSVWYTKYVNGYHVLFPRLRTITLAAEEKTPCVSLLLRFCWSCFWRFTLFVTLVYIQTVAGLWRDKLPMSIIEKLDVGRRCAVKKAKLETVSR